MKEGQSEGGSKGGREEGKEGVREGWMEGGRKTKKYYTRDKEKQKYRVKFQRE